MSTYAAALKTARLQAVLDAIDGGSASGPAYLEIATAGFASILATIPLAAPSGAVSGAVLTFDFPVEDTSADNSGVAAVARIKDSDGNVIVDNMSVGTSGAEINITSTTIVAGQTVELTTGSITHP